MTLPPASRPERQWTRRLSDKLRLAFHTACDEEEFPAAEQLLNQLCKDTLSQTRQDRRKPENLIGACERLANLLLWRAENHTDLAAAPDDDERPRSPPKRQHS